MQKISWTQLTRDTKKGEISIPLEIEGVGVLVDFEWFTEVVDRILNPLVEVRRGAIEDADKFEDEVKRTPINDDGSERGVLEGLAASLPNTKVGV